jgi:hypothetical protein
LIARFGCRGLSLAVGLTIPAVIAGVVLMLWLTRTTLNIQSFMGAIMAIGVAVANAILLVTFAERSRVEGREPLEAAIEGARSRLRPILMTSFAMLAGMMPMALGLAEGGEQSAPLGRAVPASAVGSDSDGNFVYTITDNRITRLAVKTGLVDSGRIEVTAGLSEETMVVASTKGVPPLRTAVQIQMARENS